jgi:hypothetical protein
MMIYTGPSGAGLLEIIIHLLKDRLAGLNLFGRYAFQSLIQRPTRQIHCLLLQLPGKIRQVDPVYPSVLFGGNPPDQLEPLQVVHQTRNARLVPESRVA